LTPHIRRHAALRPLRWLLPKCRNGAALDGEGARRAGAPRGRRLRKRQL